MKIWIATVGEPILQDGDNVRLLRSGQFAKWLSNLGHDVTFLTNTMNHSERRQRFNKTTEIKDTNNCRTICLWGRRYRRSVSISRILSHKDVARSFRSWIRANDTALPDIIIAAYPIVEFCDALADFAEQHNIPLVIDCRDAWPDIFAEILPSWFRQPLLKFLNYKTKRTLCKATALTGHSKGFLYWGLKKAGRDATSNDFVFPFTYPKAEVTPQNKKYSGNTNIVKTKCIIFFSGILTKRNDLEVFMRSLAQLTNINEYELRIAGAGENEMHLRKIVKETKINAQFLGWIDQSGLRDELQNAHFGLLPYVRKDFQLSIPNKVSEYLAAGLPILNCTSGEVEQFIKENSCGFTVDLEAENYTEQLLSIVRLIHDGKRWQTYSHNSKKAFDNFFEQDTIFERVEKKLLALKR